MSMLDDAMTAAREWIADVATLEQVPQMARDDDVTMCQIIRHNYDGGWIAFVEADQSMDKAVVWLLMVRKFGIEFANAMFPKESK